MQYLLEILKIIEGALKTDRNKVVAYADQLAEKLKNEGDIKTANRIKRILNQSKLNEVSLAKYTSNGRLPVDSESRLYLADEEQIDLKNSDIFLEPELQSNVEEFIRYINSADHLLSQGVGISPSMLIHGPPGCGKTELARNISAILKLPLLTARTDSIISSYLGSTAKNLRMLFEHSMARPCVLFLDDFDAVGKLRDDQYELGELKRVVVSLLQNIDAMDNKTVLIAATNHEHLLDPAIWRRFAYKIRLDYPSSEIRKKLFSKYLKNFSDSQVISLLVAITNNLSGSDIKQLSESAIRSAILDGIDKIDLLKLIKTILKLQLPEEYIPDEVTNEVIFTVRNFNPKVFTYQRLSQLFGVSVGKLSHLFKSEDNELTEGDNYG